MERRHLGCMARAGRRPFGRVHDRRTFAEAAASEEIRELKGGAVLLSGFVAHLGEQADQPLTWDVVEVRLSVVPPPPCRKPGEANSPRVATGFPLPDADEGMA